MTSIGIGMFLENTTIGSQMWAKPKACPSGQSSQTSKLASSSDKLRYISVCCLCNALGEVICQEQSPNYFGSMGSRNISSPGTPNPGNQRVFLEQQKSGYQMCVKAPLQKLLTLRSMASSLKLVPICWSKAESTKMATASFCPWRVSQQATSTRLKFIWRFGDCCPGDTQNT